jgi:single-strand DNA-binding protein
MSRSLNRAVLIGNVGGVPELRTTASGSRVATFSLATSRRWTDHTGRAQERTEWHRVVAWDPLAEVAARRLRKGDRVYLSGRVEYRSWDGPGGRRRHATEILAEDLILLGGPGTEVDRDHPS